MRLSNKSTFSLVCLILLLGFIAVPVMAHPPADDGTRPGNLTHAHPLLETLPAQNLNPGTDPGQDSDVTDPGEPEIGPHNAHPMVTSITLKEGDTVRDDMVAVDATTNTTFTLVVDFDMDVVGDGTATAVPALDTGIPPDLSVGAALVAGDFTFTVLNVDNSNATAATITTINRVADDDSVYELVITPGAYPTGTADANDRVLMFRIELDAADGTDGVYSLQTRAIPPGEVNAIDVPGGGNYASGVYAFTLVNELPELVPADAPVVTITGPTDNLVVGTEASVMLAFTGTASGEAITIGEYVVTQTSGTTTVELSRSYDAATGTLTFTPTAMGTVTVRVLANAVANSEGTGNADTMETFTVDDVADETAPTVMITSALGTGDNAGKVVFTFTFSEALMAGSFTSEDIDRTQSNVLLAGEPMMSTTDPMVYTLVVTPPATGSATIVLKTGSVEDAAGNELQGDQMHTYTPAGPATITTTDLGDTTAGASLTITFSKDPGTVTAGTTTLTGTGMTRMLTAAATAGSHSIALAWTGTEAGTHDDGTGTVTYNIPAAEVNTSGDITIEAGEYVVVVRDTAGVMGALLTAYDPNVNLAAWMGMPDLQNIFETGVPITGPAHGGGALILRQSGTTSVHPGTVGISEIMWAIDLSQLNNAEARKADQWIELHNLNTTAVTVKLSWKTGAKDIAGDANINGDLAAPYLDVVTNVFHDRAGNRNGPWVLPGQNGNPIAGVNFVSAARKGNFSLTSKHGNKFNKRYTRSGSGENATNSPDGRNKDQWAASTVRYALRAEAVTTQDGRSFNVAYEDHGTPGRANTFSPERADVKDARTDINPSRIIINEVANRNDEQNQYEWIELRNLHTETIDLNNYLISILTGVGKDQHFIILPNNGNAKIPSGGVLLLVDSDPYGDDDHPLSVGWNVDKNPEDQVPGLASIGINATSKEGRYKVVQFGGHGGNFTSGLPDDGNFILVVRRPDNHEGDHGHGGKGRADLPTDQGSGDRDLDKIEDIAGYAPGLNTGLGYKNAISQTHLWPLKSQGGPDDRNRLSASKVRFRRNVSTRDGRAGTGNTHNDRKPDQLAFKDVGYTGIGYKRQASNSGIHGGTPGYDNGARKGRVSDLAMSKLIISEIMVSQGEEGARTKLPQWIEIYNPSDHPVGLGGWRLIIENPRDPIRTINLGGGTVKTILSKQTILVVSGSARDIGSDTLPSSTVFPATRVYNVYQHQKNEFNMTSRFDPILDQEAFHITLIDGAALDLGKADQKAIADDPTKSLRVGGSYYTISDTVGNLDGDPRTNDTPEDNGKMKFEMGMTEDGDRTSIIRIFDGAPGTQGVARDGTGMVKPLGGADPADVARMRGIDSKYSWVHAADTEQRLVRHTWYGDESDWGTPADRGGQILPVELSSFRPALEDGKVVIRWATDSELDNAGFNILRSETRNGEYKQVNTDLIQGAGTTGERTTYNWVDATAKPGVVYYYQIEDVSFAGEHQVLAMTKLKGLISADNKLTTTWGELKEVQ